MISYNEYERTWRDNSGLLIRRDCRVGGSSYAESLLRATLYESLRRVDANAFISCLVITLLSTTYCTAMLVSELCESIVRQALSCVGIISER